jgi:hypothetical protein
MKIMRVYSGADGQSHFDEIEVEVEKLQPTEGIIFRHVPSSLRAYIMQDDAGKTKRTISQRFPPSQP